MVKNISIWARFGIKLPFDCSAIKCVTAWSGRELNVRSEDSGQPLSYLPMKMTTTTRHHTRYADVDPKPIRGRIALQSSPPPSLTGMCVSAGIIGQICE